MDGPYSISIDELRGFPMMRHSQELNDDVHSVFRGRIRLPFKLLVLAALLCPALSSPSPAEEPVGNATVRESFAKRAKELTIDVKGRKITFCYVPAGKFTMGSPATEEGRGSSEGPARTVTITRPFYLGKYEVTQAQYQAVTGENPSDPAFIGETLPVHALHFRPAMKFCKKLSTLTGVSISLPTEAQWEYACRAGTETRFSAGDAEEDLAKVAWYHGNSDDRPHPVGEKKPNAFGLYDMHCNISELCLDSMRPYADLPDTDPVGEIRTHGCAVRGGYWMNVANECRSANRLATTDGFLHLKVHGIRLVINEPRD
jgi:formylglycine-generating enzyme required for sulfatase activity